MKKRNLMARRIASLMLAGVLCAGELGSSGMRVFAAEESIEDAETDTAGSGGEENGAEAESEDFYAPESAPEAAEEIDEADGDEETDLSEESESADETLEEEAENPEGYPEEDTSAETEASDGTDIPDPVEEDGDDTPCFSLGEGCEALMSIDGAGKAQPEEEPGVEGAAELHSGSLTPGQRLELTEDTVLYLDNDITLGGISGLYSLTLRGAKTLTVNGGDNKNLAVSIENLALKDSANMIVNSKSSNKFAMAVQGNLSIESGSKLSVSGGGGAWVDYAVIKGEYYAVCSMSAAMIVTNNITIAKGAKVTASGGFDKDSDYRFGLGAGGDIVVEGELSAEGTYGLYSETGDITINHEISSLSGEKYGIYVKDGSLTINKSVAAKALNSDGYGIWANDDIEVNDTLVAEGKKAAVYSDDGNIILYGSSYIASPSDGFVKDGTVKDSNGKTAAYVQISIRSLTGTVSLGTPVVGEKIYPEVTGFAKELYEKDLLLATWYYNDGSEWKKSSPGGDKAKNGHLVSEEEAGRSIRVSLSSPSYDGRLESAPVTVIKRSCTRYPLQPQLVYDKTAETMTLKNARADQEYLLFEQIKTSLTEEDWKKSVKPEKDGELEFDFGKERTYYIYSRIKETAGSYAGVYVSSSSCYCGESEMLQSISFVVDEENAVNCGFGYYSCAEGAVLKLDIVPTPPNAVFNGVYASGFTVAGYDASGLFFEDSSCETKLATTKAYKTVYFKVPEAAGKTIDVSVQHQQGAYSYYTSRFTLYIGDSSGKVSPAIVKLMENTGLFVGTGEKLEGIALYRYPMAANDLSEVVVKAPEGAPAVSFNNEDFTMDIDAAGVAAGKYSYELVCGGTVTDSFEVEVSGIPLEGIELLPDTISARRGMSYDLVTRFTPANADYLINWSSSKPSVVSVDDKGKITAAADAAYGETATITAEAGGLTASCLVTIYGQDYALAIAGTDVNTDNMDDILGDGCFSYNGKKVLTVQGDIDTVMTVIDNDIDGLIINVIGDSNICSGADEAIRTSKSITVTGSGRLTVTAPLGVCIGGSSGSSLSIVGLEAALEGEEGAVKGFAGGIELSDCRISVPADAEITDGSITEAGKAAKSVTITTAEEEGLRVSFTGAVVKKNDKGEDSAEYTGKAITPEVEVRCAGEKLVVDRDYTVSYSNNVNVNKEKPATVTVKGKGSLSDSITLSFIIEPVDINKVTVGNLVIVKDGKAAPVLSYSGMTLKEGTDYSFEQSGTTILITGKGNYEGERSEALTVKSEEESKNSGIDVTLENLSFTYNGEEQLPGDGQLVVKDADGKVLTEGVDYLVTYSDGVDAGTVKVTVTGIGAYSGTWTGSYKITPVKINVSDKVEDISKVDHFEVGTAETEYYYRKEGVTPELNIVAVVGTTKITLTEGRDYKVSFSKNKKAGIAKYKLKFIGNFKGSKYKGNNTFVIKPAPEDTSKITVIAGNMVFKKKGKYQPKFWVIADGALVPKSALSIEYADSSKKLEGAADGLSINVKTKEKKNFSFGTVSTTYNVNAAAEGVTDISKAKPVLMQGTKKTTKVEYTGSAIEFKADGDIQLCLKIDKNTTLNAAEVAENFDIYYADNTAKGKATVILVPKAGKPYTGACAGTFKIVARKMK